MSNHPFSACMVKVKHTEESAKAKISFLGSVKRRKVRGLRFYKCDYCEWYHLTSRGVNHE